MASVSPTACTRSVPTRRSRALGLRIAEYKAGRLAVRRGGKPLTAAAANRPLGLLRNLLRQALRWKIIPEVPEIEFEDEPAGIVRFLRTDEERPPARGSAIGERGRRAGPPVDAERQRTRVREPQLEQLPADVGRRCEGGRHRKVPVPRPA